VEDGKPLGMTWFVAQPELLCSQLQSPQAGEVVSFVVEDGKPVEYGEVVLELAPFFGGHIIGIAFLRVCSFSHYFAFLQNVLRTCQSTLFGGAARRMRRRLFADPSCPL